MLEKNKRGFILYLSLLLYLPAINAQINVELAKPESKGVRSSTEAIRLFLPESEVKNLALAIELDNIDISQLISRDGDYISYTPIQPLSAGDHELRLVVYTDDGGIDELGYWQLNIKQTALLQNFTLEVNSQYQVSQRIVDHNLTNPKPGRTQGQGSTALGFDASGKYGFVRGQADLFYNSNVVQGQEEFENGEFWLQLGNKHISAMLGHQQLEQESLVMSNYRRKGASVQLNVPVVNAKLTGFSLSSEDRRGLDHGLGIGDPERRVDGFTASTHPLTENPKALYLAATWLTGEGQDASGLVSAIDGTANVISKGKAWSVLADSQLFDDRLRLRFEYAKSDHDIDTSDNLKSDQDQSYSALIGFNDVFADDIYWNAAIEAREVGTFFKSIGNPSLPSDKRIYKIYGGLQWQTMGLQASYDREIDNVEHLRILPRIETNLATLALNWSPITEAESWFGTPSYALFLSRQWQDQIETPTGYLLGSVDNLIYTAQFSANFSYSTWNWNLLLGEIQQKDSSGFVNDTNTHSLGLGASWFPNERFTLSQNMQLDMTQDWVANIDSTTLTYSFNGDVIIVPDWLRSSVNYTLNHNTANDDITDNLTNSIVFSLDLTLVQPKSNFPGFELALSGQYNDFRDSQVNDNSLENYQAFVTLRTFWPISIGQSH